MRLTRGQIAAIIVGSTLQAALIAAPFVATTSIRDHAIHAQAWKACVDSTLVGPDSADVTTEQYADMAVKAAQACQNLTETRLRDYLLH